MGIYTQIDSARAQLNEMFAMPLADKATIASASVAQNRFGDAPWAQDRVQDAAFYAWASWVGYNQQATDGSAIPAYKPAEDGKDNTFTRVNRILGMADGLGRQAATQESELDAFIGCFSDLVPDAVNEDPAVYLEERLGGTVTFSPAVAKAYNEDFDGYESALDNAAFYVTDETGRKQALSLRTVAARLSQLTDAQMEELFASADIDMAVEHYSEVLDRIVTWAMGHDSVVQLVTEEPEPEFCPLAKATITDMKTGQVREVLVDGRQPNYSVQQDDTEAYVPDWDFATEQDDINADGVATFKHHSEMLEWAEQVAASVLKLWHGKPWDSTEPATILVPNRDGGFDEVQLTDYQTWMYAYTHGLHIQPLTWEYRQNGDVKLRNIHRVALAMGVTLGQENYNNHDFYLLDEFCAELSALNENEVTAVLNHIASLDEQNHVELLGWLVRVTGESLLGSFENTIEFSTQELRDTILAEVDAGRMYPSQAAILLAKLAGKHQNAAKRLGQLVFDNSTAKKALLGQKRVDQKVELLWAEQESRGLFGLELPECLIAVVGKLSDHAFSDFGRWYLNIRHKCAIVGCSDDARQLAEEYGVRYIDIPVFQGYNGPMTTWAEMQAISIANLSYVGQCNQTKAKAMAQAFGHRFIGLTK